MSLDKAIKAIRDPREAVFRLHHQVHRKLLGRQGVRVMEEEWDNLIILDACRYDIFSEYANLRGKLEKRVSRGSHTKDFLINNFSDEKFYDTVYVSATPQLVSTGVHNQFYKFVPLWETSWNNNLNTVPPDETAVEAISAFEENPDKRIILHFLQPHYPFIGETGRSIEHRTVSGDGLIDNNSAHKSIWERLKMGEISEKTVRKAYIENLEVVIPEVQRLIDRLPGRTVVTSDHGNSFGRYGIYGHPHYKFIKELVEVPWMIFNPDERRDIKEEDRVPSDIAGSNIKSRLQHLGYV